MTSESDIPATWGAQLTRAEQALAAAGLPAPREDAVELLSYLLGVPESVLLARPSSPMQQLDTETYATWIARRLAGEGPAHITGHLAFMGLDIVMGQQSPLPPPDAQQVVETALEWARRSGLRELLAARLARHAELSPLLWPHSSHASRASMRWNRHYQRWKRPKPTGRATS
jgi:methylase of polypeptide subunit release factors